MVCHLCLFLGFFFPGPPYVTGFLSCLRTLLITIEGLPFAIGSCSFPLGSHARCFCLRLVFFPLVRRHRLPLCSSSLLCVASFCSVGFFLLASFPCLAFLVLLATVSSSYFRLMRPLSLSSSCVPPCEFRSSSCRFVAFCVLFGLTPLWVLGREILF